MKQEPETIGDVVLLWAQSQWKTPSKAALALGISASAISQAISGHRRPTPEMLVAMGFKRVDLYLPIECEVPQVGFQWKDKA